MSTPPAFPTDAVGMAYDLRSKYAQIVGDILEEIAIFRDKRNYPKWFSLLEDLHIEINQKLSEGQKKKYIIEVEKCVKVLNKNSSVYLGTSQDGEQRYSVYMALKDLDMWLREMMEKNKMFGNKWDDDGL